MEEAWNDSEKLNLHSLDRVVVVVRAVGTLWLYNGILCTVTLCLFVCDVCDMCVRLDMLFVT